MYSQHVDKERSVIDLLQFHSPQEKSLFEAFYNGEKPSLTDFYLFSENSVSFETSQSILSRWSKFSEKFKSRKDAKHSARFLKQAFYKVHRKFLKEYKNHSSLPALLSRGEYDCLSGTSLYVLLLEELGYSYEIKETDYHIYLLVKTAEDANSDQQFLLESTDPAAGFISDEKKIIERQEYYLTAPAEDEMLVQGISTASPEYQFSRKVDNSINGYQLAGLHYYNQGIYHYNKHHYLEAIQSLQKALFLYNSSRIQEFLDLTVSVALASDKLNAGEKQKVKMLHQKWIKLSVKQEMAQNN